MTLSMILWQKKEFMIVRNGSRRSYYYTVVRNIGSKKDNPHTHLNDYRTAKLIAINALQGIVPEHLPKYLKESIQRLLK